MTPISVVPYMLQTGCPNVCSTKSAVSLSIGSPVKESLSRHTVVRRRARVAHHAVVRGGGRDVGEAVVAASAFSSRSASNRPGNAPMVRPSASGASVPCHRPCPQAGDDGQKKRSPGRRPVPYSAATISVTIARCECLTAAGSSRVVPDVYW